MPHAFIIDAIRSPRGIAKPTGALHSLTPVDLLAQMFTAMQLRHDFDTAEVTDAVIGCVTQTGEQGGNIGKTAALVAGWDKTVSGVTINRYCASGLSALNWAAMQSAAMDAVTVAGGIEMMSRVRMFADNAPLFSDPAVIRKAGFLPLPMIADIAATRDGITRDECDSYAAMSQQRAAAALDAGHLDRSLVPVTDSEGKILLSRDETPRRGTTAVTLGALKTVYQQGEKLDTAALTQNLDLSEIRHVHTSGNAPCMADGASLALIASEKRAGEFGFKPRARIVAHADAGSAAGLSGDIDATRKALALAALQARDIDLFEVRDSFAAATIGYLRALDVPLEKFNVCGSSIALGHPLGATGVMLIATLLDELERRGLRYGLAAITGAMGVATATIIDTKI